MPDTPTFAVITGGQVQEALDGHEKHVVELVAAHLPGARRR